MNDLLRRYELDLSIVVPIFNEEENVGPLWEELRAVLDGMAGRSEVIYVDDGSTDDSAARARQAAGSDPRFVLVRLARNYGQSAALAAGIDRARGRVIVPLDGDRQNDPAEIPRLTAMLSDDVDVVCGWRRERNDAPLRSAVSRAANRLIGRVTGVRLHDYGCTLKVFKAEFIRPVAIYGEMHRFLPVFARALGARIVEEEVNHRPRVAGRSKYGLDRTFRVALDLVCVQFMTRYRGRAMRFFGRFVWGQGLSAAACLAIGIAGWLGGGWEGGLWLLASVVLAVGATLTLGLGLVSELLWRTNDAARGERPFRLVDEVAPTGNRAD